MSEETLFFPLALAVLNFGCLNTFSSSNYPELKKMQEKVTAKYGISPDELEKQCDRLLSDTKTPETKDPVKGIAEILARDQASSEICGAALATKILRKDSRSKDYAEKICAIGEFSCKELFNEECSSGDSSACEVKKALGY